MCDADLDPCPQPNTASNWQVPGVENIAAIKGACYIKYMAAATERSYCSSYNGQDRGILLQLGQLQVRPLSFPA